MAWRNLWRNRLRTILAALGIVIGVVAIAGLGITGSALRYGTVQQFSDLTNQATVMPGEDAEDRYLTEAQVQAIDRIASNATVIPVKNRRMIVTSHTGEAYASVEQVTNPRAVYTAHRGTIPEPFRTGVLLSNETAARLNVTVGDLVIVGDQSHQVRAILGDGGIGYRHGSVVGAGLSAGIGALLYDTLYGDPMLVFRWASARYLVVGFGFGAFASVLSGIYPAWKAANERPVEAIRS